MENLNELEYIEQELVELRNHLKRSLTVVDALAKIPAQFELEDYKDLKKNLQQIKADRSEFIQFKASANQRLTEIETLINSRATEFKNGLAQLRDELERADIHLSNYNAQLAKQVSEIKEELAFRLSNFLIEWTKDEATQTFLDKIFDAKLNAEFEILVQHLSEAGFNAQHFEKQEMLETELRLTQSSLQDTQRQLQLVRNFTTVTGLTVAITLGLVILQLITNRPA